ncbi:MAG: hypothetical protein AAF267_20645 [Deinococcota bacterium]
MKQANLRLILLLFLGLSLAAYAQNTSDLPKSIVFTQVGIGPEGIEYDDASERFLVGSIHTGSVYAVTDDGEVTELIQDGWLEGSLGLHIDQSNNRLLVANIAEELVRQETPTEFQSGLGIYDLATGQVLHQVDLSRIANNPVNGANDVTVDADGNAYVTDFLDSVIYKVTPAGEASVLIESDLLMAGGFGSNGIDYHPDGFLIVAVSFAATFVKVPLDTPSALSLVDLDRPLLADGLIFQGNDLIATARTPDPNAQTPQEMPGVVARIVSDDNWQTARVVESIAGFDAATTSAVRDDAIYAINAYLNEPERASYEIIRVDFSHAQE